MKLSKRIIYAIFFSITLLSLQSCNQINDSSSHKSKSNFEVQKTNQSCSFNGQTVQHNGSVSAFLNSTVGSSSTCVTEERVCSNGILSGSYNYASCTINAPAACLFNGQTIQHGSSVTASQNSTVASGSSCVTENRVCSNGVLSGSFAYASCQVNAPASCLFNGLSIPHGINVPAFSASTVPFGQDCQMEYRTCDNGILNGHFGFATCLPNVPASCSFNGQTIAHLQQITTFENSTVPFGETCKSHQVTCYNGRLSGNGWSYSSCNVNVPAACRLYEHDLIRWQTFAHNQIAPTYPYPFSYDADGCKAVNKTCENGYWKGGTHSSENFASCKSKCPAGSTYDNDSGKCQAPTITVNHPERSYLLQARSSESEKYCQEIKLSSNHKLDSTSYTETNCTDTIGIYWKDTWATYKCASKNCKEEPGVGKVSCINKLTCNYYLPYNP